MKSKKGDLLVGYLDKVQEKNFGKENSDRFNSLLRECNTTEELNICQKAFELGWDVGIYRLQNKLINKYIIKQRV